MEEKSTDKFIVVGDKVLLKPKQAEHQTKAGLLLPPGVRENEKVDSGYVVKTGPGFPIPAVADIEETWKGSGQNVRYIPLQVHVGDLAIYLQKESYEIEYDGEKYVIVPQAAIMLLIRDEGMFD